MKLSRGTERWPRHVERPQRVEDTSSPRRHQSGRSDSLEQPKFDDALLEPICMAGIVRYNHSGTNFILFSNPHNLEGGREGTVEPGKSRARKNLSIKISRDEGQTWPVNKLLEDGPSAYSDLAVTHQGTILCFLRNRQQT